MRYVTHRSVNRVFLAQQYVAIYSFESTVISSSVTPQMVGPTHVDAAFILPGITLCCSELLGGATSGECDTTTPPLVSFDLALLMSQGEV